VDGGINERVERSWFPHCPDHGVCRRRGRLQERRWRRDLDYHWSGLGCVLSLAIDPTDPTIIYAGTDAGAFKTTDGGGHWNPIDNGIVLVSGNPPWHSAVTAIVIDPRTPPRSTPQRGGGERRFQKHQRRRELDCYQQRPGHERQPGCSRHGYGSFRSGHPYVTGVTGLLSAKTIDGGATWTTLPVVAFGYAAVVNPVQTSTVYIAGPSGISKTVDGGATWSQSVNV